MMPRARFRCFTQTVSLALLLACGLSPSSGVAAPVTDLKTLYLARQWFQLRTAVRAMPDAPRFYRAAVAAAFHDDATAGRVLREIVEASPDTWEATEANRLLGPVRLRTELHQREPSSRPAKLPRLMRGGHWYVAATINGKAVDYIFDTGAALSVVSESGAKELGLELEEFDSINLDGGTGRGIPHRYWGVARRVCLGSQEVRDVLFTVLPDDTHFFHGSAGSARGVIGLPVIQALETVRWDAQGNLELGFPSTAAAGLGPNLAFDREILVAEVGFERDRLVFRLDTGADGTNLYLRFRTQFAALAARGKIEPRQSAGVSGPTDYDALVLPALTLRLGVAETILNPAEITLRADLGEGLHGNLGLDLLNQAQETTIDFCAMRLDLRAPVNTAPSDAKP